MRMEKPSYYSIIPSIVRYDRDLKPNEKLLYAEISALMNQNGYCWATNKYFAELFDVAPETVSRWIGHLIEKGYVKSKIIYAEDGKTILQRKLNVILPVADEDDPIDEIINRGIDEKIKTPIDKKIKSPIDEKIKENNTRINNTSINNNNISSSSGDDAAQKEPDVFEELWKLYPRKEGKKDAYKAYKRAIKSGTTNDQIRQGIENYKAFLKAKNETTYIKQGSTFFNGEHWNDEFDLTQRGDPYDIRNQYWDESDPTVH